MRIAGLLLGAGSKVFAVAALLLFLAAFLAILIWVLTRPRGQMRRHARLPLDESAEPMEPRETTRDDSPEKEGGSA